MTGRRRMEQAVAGELKRRGHYDDLADAGEWMTLEAADAVRAALESGDDGAAAVRAVLVNSGLHEPDDPAEAACLEADSRAVVRIVRRLTAPERGGSPCP